MKTLVTRTITGIVFLVVILGSLFLPWYVFHILITALACIGIHEYYKMMKKQSLKREEIVLIFLTIVLFAGLALIQNIDLSSFNTKMTLLGLFVIAFRGLVGISIVMMLFSIYNIYQKKEKSKPVFQRFPALYSLLWITAPFLVMVMLNDINMPLLLALMIIIYAYDTLAYCAGSLFGKHKLFERISPKKSWEGLVISLIMTSAASISFLFIPYFQNGVFTTVWHWIGFALLVIVSATYGDLNESLIKRSYEVKDSG
ncbi:MAG: phosphatidate cytidylyltransferase, partial [Bacteroidales bacterium]|nr:phosphatidate cytidylyltransferase [Bacteroidales bacterium]